MALPFLPGNSFDQNLGKEKFHKSHHFSVDNDVHFMFGDDKTGIGGTKLPGQRIDPLPSQFPADFGNKQPTWIAYDRQVLAFDAFFQESVPERREEQYRIRRCKVLFYLADDTIQVLEPRHANSGLPQGTIVRRQRMKNPDSKSNEFYTMWDVNVGTELSIFGRKLRLVACDEFTHDFLRKLGVLVGEPEPIPDDQYTNSRRALAESMQPLRPYERLDKLRSFLDHDKHVLRYYCFWDDTESLYGDPREMVLHYFLADDTVEIYEHIPPNAGRDSAALFLKRGKLPKNSESVPLPGTVTERTLLNVLGHPQRGGRYILDNLKIGKHVSESYTDKDLTIGASINVYGRKFLIYDCDEFTKEYQRRKFGITDFCQAKVPKKNNTQVVTRRNPPYNGWGSEEDSLANCHALIPKPPKQSFMKFMEKDKRGLDSYVLRFTARLITAKPLDKDRRFNISFFLSDDSVLIFEQQIRNSGFTGGTFLERGRVRKPNQERFSTVAPEYYKSNDFYVGARLYVNDFVFELLDADEYAYAYMEAHPSEFPLASRELILNKMRPQVAGKCAELMAYARSQDPDGLGSFNLRQLDCLLRQLVGVDNSNPTSTLETSSARKEAAEGSAAPTTSTITTHELITIARHYAERQPKKIDFEAMIGLAQQHLRKMCYEELQSILCACRQADAKKTGELTQELVRRICRANRLPLPDNLLLAISEFCVCQNGMIKYESLLNQLNWRVNPMPPPQVPMNNGGISDIEWLYNTKGSAVCGGKPKEAATTDDSGDNRKSLPGGELVQRVRYEALINDLCGNTSDCGETGTNLQAY